MTMGFVALAAFAGAVMALGIRAMFARRVRSRRARAALDALGRDRHRRIDVLATGKVVVIEGRAWVEGFSGKAIAVTSRDATHASHSAHPHVQIETDDKRVSIDGPMNIVLGSRGSALPIDVASYFPKASGRHPAELLYDGDRIAARGVLREHAGGGARDTKVILAIAPPVGEDAIRVVHLGTPKELAPRGRIPSALAGAILGGAVCFALLPHKPKHVQLITYEPCAPDIDAALDRDDPNAASMAEHCGDHARAARAYWQDADFTNASREFSAAHWAPSASEVAAHLFAGNSKEAAIAARRFSDPGWTCLADALDARSGDSSAQDRLDAAATNSGPSDGTARLCALLEVDLLKGSARSAALARLWHPNFPYRYEGTFGPTMFEDEERDSYTFNLLRHEVEPARPIAAPSWYRPDAFWPGRNLLPLPMGLMEVARRSLVSEKDAGTRSDYDVHAAVFFSYAGEHAKARAEIDAILDPRCAQTEHGPCFDSRDVLSPAAALAMRARDFPRADNLLHQTGEHTEAHGFATLRTYLDLLEGDASAFAKVAHSGDPDWDAASTRKGGELAAELSRAHHDGRDVLPYVSGYMQSGQDILKSFVARSYPPGCWTCGPHDLFDRLTHRREAAQALGMTDLDNRLHGRAERLLPVFLKRDISVPLYVIGRLAH